MNPKNLKPKGGFKFLGTLKNMQGTFKSTHHKFSMIMLDVGKVDIIVLRRKFYLLSETSLGKKKCNSQF